MSDSSTRGKRPGKKPDIILDRITLIIVFTVYICLHVSLFKYNMHVSLSHAWANPHFLICKSRSTSTAGLHGRDGSEPETKIGVPVTPCFQWMGLVWEITCKIYWKLQTMISTCACLQIWKCPATCTGGVPSADKPRMYAASNGKASVIRALLSAGARVDDTDERGVSWIASEEHCRMEMMEWLVLWKSI